MNFDELLEQVLALVQRQGRVSYWAITRRFNVDDAYLADQGKTAEGMAQLHEGLRAYRTKGIAMHLPAYLTRLAEAYHRQGQSEEEFTVLAEALVDTKHQESLEEFAAYEQNIPSLFLLWRRGRRTIPAS